MFPPLRILSGERVARPGVVIGIPCVASASLTFDCYRDLILRVLLLHVVLALVATLFPPRPSGM